MPDKKRRKKPKREGNKSADEPKRAQRKNDDKVPVNYHASYPDIDYEITKAGPITLERYGRFIHMSSHMDPKQHEEAVKKAVAQLPHMKEDIDAGISRVLEILDEYDPMEVIAPIAVTALFRNTDKDTEPVETRGLADVEWLMSLSLARQYKPSDRQISFELLEDLHALLDKLRTDITFYYIYDALKHRGDNYEGKLAQTRLQVISRGLAMRGDSYWIHTKQTFEEVYRPHEDFIRRTFGYGCQDFISFIEEARRQITQSFNEHTEEFRNTIQKSYEDFQRYVTEHQGEFASLEEAGKSFREGMKDYPSVLNKVWEFSVTLGGPGVFHVVPRNDTDKNVLLSLFAVFGSNADFLQIPDWPGWPLNPSVIHEKPIIQHDGSFYLFNMPLLANNITYILDRLIARADSCYHERSLLKSKSKYLEETGLRLITQLLPSCEAYQNLEYSVIENGEEKRVELDGMLNYNDALVLLETKAGRISQSAKRGSTKRLVDNLEEIVGKAYEQGKRALKYIESNEEATFTEKETGREVTIRSADFPIKYIITLSFEPLFEFGAHIAALRELGIIEGKHWPWAVYLNDLRIISEVTEHPTVFLDYLKKRAKLNDIGKVSAVDELDLFMQYFQEGLYTEPGGTIEYDQATIISFTDKLDKYYYGQEGLISESEKPRMYFPPMFEALLKVLEHRKPAHFVSAAIELLKCNNEERDELNKHILDCEQKYAMDGKLHSIALGSSVHRAALLLGCFPNIQDDDARIDNWIRKWLKRPEIDKVTVICWKPPLLGCIDVLVRIYPSASSN